MDAIAKWHSSTNTAMGRQLHEWLNCSYEDYSTWVKEPHGPGSDENPMAPLCAVIAKNLRRSP